MCELDVFVGNYAIIDWEVYSLWLSGRSIAEAVTVFVRDNRVLITDHHVSQDIIVSDFEDNWRLFSTLETALYSQESTLPLQLLDSAAKKRVIESYHSLDAVFCREILGRKLNSKLRKDLDELSEKTGIFVRACRRQFDNIRKVFKAVEDVAPKNYVSSISSNFGLSKNLSEKYAALVFAASFRLEMGKKKLAFLTFDQVKVVSLMLINDWGDKDEAQEPTLDREFLSSLKDIKILLDKEKEHRNAVLTKLKNNEMSQTTLNDLEANYKPITRSIVSFAQNLSSNKDVKEVFVQLVEKPIEAFKSIGASPATVDLFLRAYGDVIKDNTVMVDSDLKCLIGKFMRTATPAILAIYE
jgi:hypothetical protein